MTAGDTLKGSLCLLPLMDADRCGFPFPFLEGGQPLLGEEWCQRSLATGLGVSFQLTCPKGTLLWLLGKQPKPARLSSLWTPDTGEMRSSSLIVPHALQESCFIHECV